jgi:hypothetical protein
MYRPLEPSQLGSIFGLERLNSRQQYKRSLISNDRAGDVKLFGVSDVDLVILFRYYAWTGGKITPASWEKTESAVWSAGTTQLSLKMLVKSPQRPSRIGPYKGKITCYFLRILFYRHWEFGDTMTLVDSLTSDLFRVYTKPYDSLIRVPNSRYYRQQKEDDKITACDSSEESYVPERDSSPSRSSALDNT